MKAKEIVNLSDEELNRKLQELKTELFNLRFRHASGQLENPLAINLVKNRNPRKKFKGVREVEYGKNDAQKGKSRACSFKQNG